VTIVNTGDVIFQILMLGIPIAVLLLIIVLFISNRNRKKQLKRIEEKIDKLQK
jgi:preprotein translocase subunit YajC